MIRRANGVLLLVLGLASGAFALGDSYGFLMNLSFRWLTVAGAALVTLLGLAQITRARGPGSRSTFLIYAGFLVLVALAQPQRGGIAPLLAPPHDGPPITRAGYAPMHGQDLFEDMGTEARTVPTGKVMLRGFVKRLPALDARGEFILLEPSMACCLADAIALGARVRHTDNPLPAEGAWVVAFGELEALERPSPVPAFRVGAILFTAVSRTHRLVSDEVVGFLDLLDDLVARVPAERCSIFRALVQQSGLEVLTLGSKRRRLGNPESHPLLAVTAAFSRGSSVFPSKTRLTATDDFRLAGTAHPNSNFLFPLRAASTSDAALPQD